MPDIASYLWFIDACVEIEGMEELELLKKISGESFDGVNGEYPKYVFSDDGASLKISSAEKDIGEYILNNPSGASCIGLQSLIICLSHVMPKGVTNEI